jgi:hypothetical protein
MTRADSACERCIGVFSGAETCADIQEQWECVKKMAPKIGAI